MIRNIGFSSFCLPEVSYLPLIKSGIWNPGIRASFKGCLRLIFIATQLPKLNVKLTYHTRNPETGGPQVPSWPRKHDVTPLGKQHKTRPSHLFKKMDIFFSSLPSLLVTESSYIVQADLNLRNSHLHIPSPGLPGMCHQ